MSGLSLVLLLCSAALAGASFGMLAGWMLRGRTPLTRGASTSLSSTDQLRPAKGAHTLLAQAQRRIEELEDKLFTERQKRAEVEQTLSQDRPAVDQDEAMDLLRRDKNDETDRRHAI